MKRETAIRKIMRCLRLAASNNVHEAAAALRQARALMDKYGLTEVDAYASEIHSVCGKTRCRGAVPPQSLMALIKVVADGFRCDVVINRVLGLRGKGSTTVNFYGAGSDAEVAAYAFVVLRRQLEADKAKHTSRVRIRRNKEVRGEYFALGWVAAVARLFPKEVLTEAQQAAIDAKMASDHGKLKESAGRKITGRGSTLWRDSDAGYDSGSRARLHVGMGGTTQRQMEKTS